MKLFKTLPPPAPSGPPLPPSPPSLHLPPARPSSLFRSGRAEKLANSATQLFLLHEKATITAFVFVTMTYHRKNYSVFIQHQEILRVLGKRVVASLLHPLSIQGDRIGADASIGEMRDRISPPPSPLLHLPQSERTIIRFNIKYQGGRHEPLGEKIYINLCKAINILSQNLQKNQLK